MTCVYISLLRLLFRICHYQFIIIVPLDQDMVLFNHSPRFETCKRPNGKCVFLKAFIHFFGPSYQLFFALHSCEPDIFTTVHSHTILNNFYRAYAQMVQPHLFYYFIVCGHSIPFDLSKNRIEYLSSLSTLSYLVFS